jgi:methionyl-tRNA formyltransferase
MIKNKESVLILGNEENQYTSRVITHIQERFEDVSIALGTWKDPFPKELHDWQGDYIISYLSRWIVPAKVLDKAQKGAINFHPAPPEYPGVGCLNFALYEDVKEYGTTCHYMAPKVDAGPIIKVKRFPVLPEDTVSTLLQRTYEHQYDVFLEVIDLMVLKKALPLANEHWSLTCHTRKDLNALAELNIRMTPQEIKRRIRATNYGPWRPKLRWEDMVFEFVSSDNN